jgi:hypothetical protein
VLEHCCSDCIHWLNNIMYTHMHAVIWCKYLNKFIFVCGTIIIWILYWWSKIVVLLWLLWQLSLCDKTDYYQKPNKTLRDMCTGWILCSVVKVLFIYVSVLQISLCQMFEERCVLSFLTNLTLQWKVELSVWDVMVCHWVGFHCFEPT